MTAALASQLREVLRGFPEASGLAPQSQRRMGQAAHKLAAHLLASGVCDLDSTTGTAALEFIEGPLDGGPPSTATMHFRRSAVRLLFAVARRLGVATIDPTIDLQLPSRGVTSARPLTDDEMALCREAANSLGPTRHAAALSLAEATARSSELAQVRGSHVDLPRNRVWIEGSSRTDARWGRLTPWGSRQLRERLGHLAPASDPALISMGSDSAESRQASSCIALSDVLRASGLASEPDLRPASVSAWAGASAFARGWALEDVARMLGVRSLDQAAALIGWDWAAGAR